MLETMSMRDGFAVIEALIVDAYQGGGVTAEQVLAEITKAGDEIDKSMPDPRTWGTTRTAQQAARKAEAMFGPR